MEADVEDAPSAIPTLAELRDRLGAADRLEDAAKALADRLTNLEVERIEAEMEATRTGAKVDISPAEREVLGELIDRRARLEGRLRALLGQDGESTDDAAQMMQIEAGIDALESWLEAPNAKPARRVELGTRILMLIATVAAIWGAYTYHWAVLVLLIPVVGPLSALLNRGEDKHWVRLGTQRRFKSSQLEPPDDWESPAVQARLDALRSELERLQSLPPPEPPAQLGDAEADREFAEISVEQVEVEQTLMARLRREGLELDTLPGPERAAFASAARLARVKSEIVQVGEERTRKVREAGEFRDGIWRVLNQWGATAGDNSASSDSLKAGLERLASVEHDARPM